MCTQDACTENGPVHTLTPGGVCVIGTAEGVCSDDGQCLIDCNSADDCGDPGPCKSSSCVDHLCVFDNTDDPTGAQNLPGDCTKPECEDGVPGPVPDATDLPPDVQGDCRVPACDGTNPTFIPEPINTTPCNGGMFCDGEGACVTCTEDGQCGATEACNHPTCTAEGSCMNVPVAEGDACLSGSGVCTANQMCVGCLDTMDCGAPTVDCMDPICNGNACTAQQVPAGDACLINDGICAPRGDCVECINDATCSGVTPLCSSTNACQSCIDAALAVGDDCGSGTTFCCANGSCDAACAPP